jgi:serine/threonine-protein phosphatase 2A activator
LSFYFYNYPIHYTLGNNYGWDIMTDQPEASTSYARPAKYILSPAHLAAFRRSATHEDITGFVSDLNTSIVGKTLKDVQGSEVSYSSRKPLIRSVHSL